MLLVPRGHDTPRHLVPGDCVAAVPCPGPPQLLDPDQRSEVSREELRLCGCEKMSQCERVNKTNSGQVNVMMSLLIIQIRNSLKRFKIYLRVELSVSCLRQSSATLCFLRYSFNQFNLIKYFRVSSKLHNPLFYH